MFQNYSLPSVLNNSHEIMTFEVDKMVKNTRT